MYPRIWLADLNHGEGHGPGEVAQKHESKMASRGTKFGPSQEESYCVDSLHRCVLQRHGLQAELKLDVGEAGYQLQPIMHVNNCGVYKGQTRPQAAIRQDLIQSPFR
jgi:hypothetical protein